MNNARARHRWSYGGLARSPAETMRRLGAGLVAIASLAALVAPGAARAADALLAGTISAASGEKMGGVTVSAKPAGGTVTTTVFTDAAGDYYFPPLPAGKYRVWAQALSFETARGELDLGATRHQDFTLKPMQDFFRQLPGDLAMASLPEDTADDRRLKKLVINNCTGCHTASYTLQHKFDATGWSAIIDLMKHVNVSGVYLGPEHKAQGVLDYHQKELSAYLARARGPAAQGAGAQGSGAQGSGAQAADGATKIKLRPRPTGETARVVFKEYDVPVDPDLGVPNRDFSNNGSDWSLGTPSRRGSFVHDAFADLDGNLWFTSNVPNRRLTIGRIDGRSGEVKFVKLNNNANGLAANTHGMTRDPSGIIWFNVNTGRGGLGKLEPRSGKIDVYIPPTGMSPTGGATTVDWDGKGKIWSSSPDGALLFDPESETFTEFKSVTAKTPNGNGVTYGAAGDRDGNGWWSEMIIDIVNKGDVATGKSIELKLPPRGAGQGSRRRGGAQVLRELQRARLQRPGALEPGPAADGHRQGRRRALGRQFLGRHARQDRHPQHGDFVRSPPRARRDAALPRGGRCQAQRLAQHLDLGRDPQIRPGVQQLDDLRPADARHRGALHLATRARRRDGGGDSLFSHQQGRSDDLPQRGRSGCAEDSSGAVGSSLRLSCRGAGFSPRARNP